MTHKIWDAIVIGGGAAGLSAAEALGRSLRQTLVIDAGDPRNRFAAHMHNVLGHDGSPPSELLARGREEAENYGVEFLAGSVQTVRDADEEARARGAWIEIETRGGETLGTRALVVATGVTDVLPEISGLAERWGSGVLHCPYCHGWEVRGQRLAVVTTSPLGMHQARLLRQWSDDLTVFSAGLGELEPRVAGEFAARGVRMVSAPVIEIVGDGRAVSAVRTADGAAYPIDAVFVASAPVPQDAFLAGLGLARSEQPGGGTLAVDAMQRTSHPRVWAVGNVVAPFATLPVVMGAGSLVGAAVNAALVEEDFALAASGVVALETVPPTNAGAARGEAEAKR